MKIAFYANEIIQPGGFGVKTYSREIIRHLLAIDRKNRYRLYSCRSVAAEVGSEAAEFTVAEPRKRFWAFRVFPRLLRFDRPDVVFVPIQIFPFLIYRSNKPKTVVTVHDVAFLFFPDQFTWGKRMLLRWHTRMALQEADRIIVPSQATKSDILRFYPIKADRIAVIPHGSSEKLLSLAETRAEEVKRRTGNAPYALFVGSLQPRKNIVRLVEAFALIKAENKHPELKLVICGGKGWMYEKIVMAMEQSPVQKDIVWIEDADDELLAGLYRGAEFFVLPSLYEGFGLPLLEAMSFGLPTICGDNSSLSEMAGGASLLVEATSASDIAAKMEMVLSSQSLKADLSLKSLIRARAFSWEKAARATLAVLEEAAGDK